MHKVVIMDCLSRRRRLEDVWMDWQLSPEQCQVYLHLYTVLANVCLSRVS